jgi:putative membrane protein insertion efficiency factor
MGRVLVAFIRVYQKVISPMLGPRCRYYPSCSNYAVEAIRTHGALRGSLLAAWRVLRCNPFSNGGLDPVPPRHDCSAHGSTAKAARS